MSQFNAFPGAIVYGHTMTNKDVMERSTNRSAGSGPSAEPVFLVLESDVLIATDIEGSLKSITPCRVIHVNEAGKIDAVLRGEDRISAAFLDICFDKVVEKGLDRTLCDHGARIISTVGEYEQAQALARGWGMLIRPFTDDMIRNVVQPTP